MQIPYNLKKKMGSTPKVNGNAVNGDPRSAQKSTLFQGLNDGSADTAAQISGFVPGGNRVDVGFPQVDVCNLTELVTGCSIFHQ